MYLIKWFLGVYLNKLSNYLLFMGVKHIHTNIFVLLLLKAVAKQFFSGWIPDDSYLSGIAMPSVDVALFGKKAKLRLQLGILERMCRNTMTTIKTHVKSQLWGYRGSFSVNLSVKIHLTAVVPIWQRISLKLTTYSSPHS